MRSKFKILIECPVPEGGLVDFKALLEVNSAIAQHARTLATRLELLLNQSMEIEATISIDGFPPTYVNIKEHKND